MDVWSAIRTKRMVRRFRDAPLAPDQLERIVDAGRHAASSKNQQAWDFIAVEDRERLRVLSAVGPYAGHVAGAAAAIALVAPDPRQPARRCRSSGISAWRREHDARAGSSGSERPATVYDQAIARDCSATRGPLVRLRPSFGFAADPRT